MIQPPSEPTDAAQLNFNISSRIFLLKSWFLTGVTLRKYFLLSLLNSNENFLNNLVGEKFVTFNFASGNSFFRTALFYSVLLSA